MHSDDGMRSVGVNRIHGLMEQDQRRPIQAHTDNGTESSEVQNQLFTLLRAQVVIRFHISLKH